MAIQRTLRVLAVLSIPLSCGVLSARQASACGGLYLGEGRSYEAPKPQNVPRVEEVPLEPTQEPTLIVFDDSHSVEHLIREVRFDRATKNVAFLVPVPSRPSVAAVEQSPFESLAELAPMEAVKGAPKVAKPTVAPKPSIALDPSYAVTTVGSFTVTVLAASDTNKVDAWIKDSGAEDTPARREWMAHYKALGFHYAAFHYHSSGDEWAIGATSETVRLTFESRVPFVPYREVRDEGKSRGDERRTDLWVVAKDAVHPIAGRLGWSDLTLGVPFLEGTRRSKTAQELAALLASVGAVLPDGPMVLQTFRDRKSDRTNYGDVLLAPASPGDHVGLAAPRFAGDSFPRAVNTVDQTWARERTRYLAVLDPRLEGESAEPSSPTKPPPVAIVSSPAVPSSAPWHVVGASGGAVLALLISAAVRRRARIGALGIASLFVIGCAASLGDSELASTSVATPRAIRFDDREASMLAALDGHHEDVQVDALESFSRDQYRQLIRAHFLGLRACYEPVWRRDRGTVDVRLRIDSDGSVAAAKLDGGTLESVEAAKCIAHQLAQITFPKGRGPVTLHYAVDLGVETVYGAPRFVARKMPIAFQSL